MDGDNLENLFWLAMFGAFLYWMMRKGGSNKYRHDRDRHEH